ncbi:MAG: FtsQ-type POTRA domain-containing protein [Clostridia bacterium]|nr:FtsQ-type POTRA domain-containing protein [Clostridia bacterium]
MYKKRKNRASLIGLSFFLLFCLLLSFYFFINSAFFNLQEIKVSGCSIVAEDTVIKLSGLNLGTNLFKINTHEVITKLEMHPVIKTLSVFRKPPHTLVLKVEERTPLALVVGSDGYLAIDAEGIYIQQVHDLLNLNLPVISGLSLKESISLGADLTTPGLEAALQLLRLMDREFLESVAEIRAASPYSLIIKMLQGVEIHFGEPKEIEQKLQIIQELLVENEELINNQTVEYIDLRYNSLPVIKRKNKNL